MIDEKKSDMIIHNLNKFLGLKCRFNEDDRIIYATIERPYDAKILDIILLHYNVLSYIRIFKTMNKSFVLVVF